MLDIILITSFVFVVWWAWSMKLPAKFPPGPRFPLPIIGDSYRMTSMSMTATVKDMRKKYGDVFGFYITSNQKVVFVCDPKLISELAFGDEFQRRRIGHDIAVRIRGGASLGGDTPGVLFTSNQTWVEQRRFCLSTLRDFGFGKLTMEEFISDEVDKFIDYLETKSTGGKNSLQPRELFSVSVINSIWRMINGSTYENDDEKLLDLIEKNHFFTQQVAKPACRLPCSTGSLRRYLKGQV